MAYEIKEGQGSLFKNDKKESDNHPDYKGSILINGVDCWLSAWLKTGKNGKWMSLSAKPKDAQKTTKKPERNDDDYERPF